MSNKHRLAIVDPKKCKPNKCGLECKKWCPVNAQSKLCVEVNKKDKRSNISEVLCTGCGICVKKCPFDAIKIVNLPKEVPVDETIHRYGENSFKLFRLPIPKLGIVLGLVGTNGVGKTTAIKILSGKGINVKRKKIKGVKIRDIEDGPSIASNQIPNLGDWNDPPDIDDIIKYFRGNELQNYFQKLKERKIKAVVKPQDVKLIPKQVSGSIGDILKRLNEVESKKMEYFVEHLGLNNLLNRDVKDLSGGELQRFAVCMVCLKKGNVFIFDEPSNFLDIKQRLIVAKIIREMIDDDKYVIVVEHDLAVLDYMSDYVCCLYGVPGAFGVVTHPSSVQTGINMFLDGYIPSENMRFRNEPLEFKISDNIEDNRGDIVVAHYEYPAMVKTFDGFKLNVEAGGFNESEIIVLLGENGTGKTTFINMLAGKVKDDSNKEVNELAISYKPQHIIVTSEGTVRDILLSKIKEAYLDPVFNSDVIKPMKIAEIIDDDVQNLSGGQKQRLAIVLCLGTPANLYLLDEPSADLDSEQRVETARVIKRFTLHNKRTAFIVEHDFMMATYLADRVVVYKGKPGKECTATSPQPLLNGMNQFLEILGVTFRRDRSNFRPRINKIGSARDAEQKRSGNYFFME